MAPSEIPMTAMAAIHARTSVRSYHPQPLDADTVDSQLRAAVRAPTAMHQEPWRFVVVQDAPLLRRLSDHCKTFFLEELHRAHLDADGHALETFQQPGFNIFYDAGTLIAICAPTAAPFAAADCWLAAQNVMLAACALGLASCVIGSAVTGLNSAQMKGLLKTPAELAVVAPIIVGLPLGPHPVTPRHAPVVLSRTGPAASTAGS